MFKPNIYTALRFLNTFAKLIDMPKKSTKYTVLCAVLESLAYLYGYNTYLDLYGYLAYLDGINSQRNLPYTPSKVFFF